MVELPPKVYSYLPTRCHETAVMGQRDVVQIVRVDHPPSFKAHENYRLVGIHLVEAHHLSILLFRTNDEAVRSRRINMQCSWGCVRAWF